MELSESVGVLPFVGPAYEKKLEKLGIVTLKDLLCHVPRRYIDFSNTSDIYRASVGDIVTIKGEVVSIINQYTKRGLKMQIAQIADETGSIQIVWFNQPFLVRTLRKEGILSVSGEVTWFGRNKAIISPEYEMIPKGQKGIHTGRILPVYPETAGLSSKWLRRQVKIAFEKIDNIPDTLNREVIEENNLVSLKKALNYVHFPKSEKESQAGRYRLSFDEVLALQIAVLKRKKKWEKNTSVNKIEVKKKELANFINSLPFTLTTSQKRSVNEILNDIKKNTPMNRLLEGEVGSGKTVVAAAGIYAAFTSGHRSVLMAPTQILATQHYQSLKELFKKHKIQVSLATSKSKPVKKADVVVGTHTLLFNDSLLEGASLVVIDEQQKFGVEQRKKLVDSTKTDNIIPHVLSMTATPIPRTVALAAYGDVDMSKLEELPSGRQKITTWVVPPEKREGAYDWIKKTVSKNGVQAFVVCPLIEESTRETLQQVKSVKKEYDTLKKLFPTLTLGLLHGKMKSNEKDMTIADFAKGKIDILVSTPVVEVGIDIPNAAIMMIETADRFGLAQLHQLRGRVGRGKAKSYCLLFTESDAPKVVKRLSAMKETQDGFKLAELDLQLRGPGEVFGLKQSGYPELKIASWQDIELIKKARKVATRLTN